MREVWGAGRETAAKVGLPRPFDPPEWKALHRIALTAKAPPLGAERVLFMSWRGWSTHMMIETVLGHAVRRRGGDAIFAYCGGRLPICEVMPVEAAPPMPCHSCREYVSGALRAAGFDSVSLHDVLDVDLAVRVARRRVGRLATVRECEAYEDQGLPLGRLVRISVAWFLSRGTLPDTPEVIDTYNSFLISGTVVARGLRAMLDRTTPDRVFMLNGTFFAEQIMMAVAGERGIPFGTYEKGFIHDSIVMTTGATASHLKVPAGTWESVRDTPLTDDESEAIDAYLGQRRQGIGVPNNFWTERIDDVDRIHRDLHLDPRRRLVVMFCNIMWDSAVLEREIAFAGMGEWVIQGINWARRHPEIDLVIRIHPAEIKLRNHPTRERMADHISHHFSNIPSNVRVVQADDPTSSYVFMDRATMGFVYSSTVGLELAARGVPVLVAADTHYRGRGFTIDANTQDEYWSEADRILSAPPDPAELNRIRELARRYAVLLFFRFHNVLAAVTEDGRSSPRIRVHQASDLDPGLDPAMDRVVAGILDGVSTVAPAGSRPEGALSV
jgi:hypothetical protein